MRLNKKNIATLGVSGKGAFWYSTLGILGKKIVEIYQMVAPKYTRLTKSKLVSQKRQVTFSKSKTLVQVPVVGLFHSTFEINSDRKAAILGVSNRAMTPRVRRRAVVLHP